MKCPFQNDKLDPQMKFKDSKLLLVFFFWDKKDQDLAFGFFFFFLFHEFFLSIEDNEKDWFLNVLHKLNVDCIIGMSLKFLFSLFAWTRGGYNLVRFWIELNQSIIYILIWTEFDSLFG